MNVPTNLIRKKLYDSHGGYPHVKESEEQGPGEEGGKKDSRTLLPVSSRDGGTEKCRHYLNFGE